MEHEERNIERLLLIDDAAGIYVPRNFYEHFDFPTWGLDISKFSALSMPENEGYWEAWDEVLRDAEYTDMTGKVWNLEQDGALFAVHYLPEEATNDLS